MASMESSGNIDSSKGNFNYGQMNRSNQTYNVNAVYHQNISESQTLEWKKDRQEILEGILYF